MIDVAIKANCDRFLKLAFQFVRRWEIVRNLVLRAYMLSKTQEKDERTKARRSSKRHTT